MSAIVPNSDQFQQLIAGKGFLFSDRGILSQPTVAGQALPG